MNKRVIYFDRVYPEYKELLESFKPEGVDLLYWAEMDEAARKEALPSADCLLVAAAPIDKTLLAGTKKVKLIQKSGIGVDNIDLKVASEMGIPVANTPGANSTGVAELTISLILALYRNLPELDRATKQGRWLMWDLRFRSFQMQDKIHGIVGFGSIGREVAKRSRAFGTRIVYYDPYRAPETVERDLEATYLPLPHLLASSDIVSLHIPLMSDTENLIGQAELALMRKNAILINVARGKVVDEWALYHALKQKVIAGAAVDAWAEEPVPADHPLLALDQVLATPHIGAGTVDTLRVVMSIAFDNMKRVLDGRPPEHVMNGVK